MTTATPDATPAPAPAWPQRAAIGLRWIAGFIVAVLAWVGLQVLDVWPAWVLAAVVTFVLLKLLDATLGLRVSPSEEIEGLDLSQHGEEGYIYI